MAHENPFETDEMAMGYARSRPPVHAHVLAMVRSRLSKGKFRCAVDIGCGAGISTNALDGMAETAVGIEPAESMLRWGTHVAPRAHFAVGTAEAIPIAADAADLLTAAGSLNYADLESFFPEAARVLSRDGVLVVYDFQTGRTFRDSPALDEWFDGFIHGYPWPPKEARELSPEILERINSGFTVTIRENFGIAVPLRAEFYVRYMLTETNVAWAVRRGTPLSEVREWCEETLAPIWKGESREVVFRGYFVCMRPEPSVA